MANLGTLRVHQKKVYKANPEKWKKYLADWMYLVAVAIPLLTVSQAVEIWVSKSAEDVSLITWCAFLLSAVSWLVYSIVYKDKPLIINSILWVAIEVIIIAGIIIYS